jgi:hypothetical protein
VHKPIVALTYTCADIAETRRKKEPEERYCIDRVFA